MLKALRSLFYLALHASSFFAFAASPISLQELTLEEKVGQLLMVHFHGEMANAEAKTLIQETYVGGFIYYNWSNSLHSPAQIAALSTGLQTMAAANPHPIPLLIATDQEGGVTTRLHTGFTIFPGNKALGMTNDAALAKHSAFAFGEELLAVGINMDLAPVIDINTNPRNPIIGLRAYGETPDIVLKFGRQALEGFKQAGIISCLKHFPGHGHVDVDSHEALPILNKSKKELEESDLIPFAQLAAQADTIMTAHILVPAIDSRHCSTLSKKTIDILRNDFSFNGVVITDSLVMDGLLENCLSVEEAAIQALNAGCDILLLGGKHLVGSHKHLELDVNHMQMIHKTIVEAVQSGRVTHQRLDQAVERILTLKQRHIHQNQTANEPSSRRSLEHQALANTIAYRALKATKNAPPMDWRHKKIALFAPAVIKEDLLQTPFKTLSPDMHFYFFDFSSPNDEEIEQAIALAAPCDGLIIFSYNAWKFPAQTTLIRTLMEMQKSTALIICRDPIDEELFPAAHYRITTFSPTLPSLRAAYSLLTLEEAEIKLGPGL